ncbi:glycosyltransferase family 2 protein [Clostridium sp. YIM B02506]|uniref:glycosyltransferase family 2 protein n=1 Tax=Clostridium sp. YIM B02506 TaxID=2910680 RepID=UPI001EEEE4FF
MDKPSVYVVLVNYNGYEDTEACIKSLRNIHYYNYKIVVVDNASTDDSYNKLEKIKEDVILIKSEKNLGFSGGNNIGIKYALQQGADYIMLLNNDTLVEPDFLNIMIDTAESSENLGIVGCKMMYYPQNDIVWYGGGYIDWNKYSGVHENQGTKDSQDDNVREVTFLTGCCMLIKRSTIEKVGYLSEEYFMYLEDLDYCAKVLDNNLRIIYNPEAKIYHKVSASTGGEESSFAIKWGTRNRFIFFKKFSKSKSFVNKLKIFLFLIISRIVKFAILLAKGNIEKSKNLMIGLKQGIKILFE